MADHAKVILNQDARISELEALLLDAAYRIAELETSLLYAVKQIPELGTVPGIHAALVTSIQEGK